MKDFAKSIRTMNSNKEEIIKKKKEEGATLKVDNGQKLEFSDGTTFVKTSFSSDYREAKNYTGNKNVGNSYSNGEHVIIKDSGTEYEVKILRDNKDGTYEAKTQLGDVVTIREEKIVRTANKKVGNEAVVLKDGDVWVVLYSNETKSKEFDTEAEARAFAKQVGNKKVGNAQKLYSDANVEIYDDGIVKLSHFPGYTQWAKDVDSIVRDEIRALEKQISDLKNAESKVKEVGKKYGLL